MHRLSKALLRLRLIPILTLLAVGPALLLDLTDVQAGAGPMWDALGVLALTFGLPYYLALVAIASVLGLPAGPPAAWESVIAALSVTALGALAQ